MHSLLQTPDGYLWIATEGGLVRFDGVAFQVYDPGDEKAFASADICCLAHNRDGLWIGTAAGVVRLQEGRFRRYGKADGLASAMIEALRPDKDGALLVETSGGWARWDKTSFATLAEVPEALRPDSQGLTAVAGSALWRASATTVAVAGDGGGMRREWSVGDPLPMGRIQAVSVDRSGLAWVGMNRGLFVLRADKAEAIPIELLTGNSVLSIFEDAEGNHWIGTETSGLHVLRRLAFRREPALADKAVTSVAGSRDGSIWVGTRDDGLRRIRNGVVDQPVAATQLTSAVVLCLAPGLHGGLWVGTPDGLDYVDENNAVWRITAGDGLPDDDVRAVAEDRDGSVWVGTRQGLAHVRRTGTKWSVVTVTSANGLGGDMVGSLLLTRDALWAGTSGGLSRISREGTIRNFTTQDGLGGLITTAMVQDQAGDLWVASQGGSLSRFDGHRFLRVGGVPQPGSRSGNIDGITADGLGFLWLRMDRGIRRVSLAALHACAGKPACTAVSGSVANYGLAEGLPNDEVVAGEPSVGWLAGDGEMWFPTRGGVAIVDALHLPIDTVPPPVVLQRFVVDGTSESMGLEGIDLPFGHARFTMEYAGLSFTAPSEVRYRFRLSGFDKDWTDAGNRRSASYTNLAPGRYLFQVQAMNKDGVWNRAGAVLRFRIVPPYYRRWWFASLAFLFLLALLAGMYLLRLRRLRGEFDAVLAERNRMAREIHDTLTQDLVGTSLQLDLISQQLSRGKVDVAMEQVKRTRQLVTDGLEEARRSIWELRVNRSQDSLPTRLTTLAQREMLGPVAPRLRLSGAYRPLEPRVEREILRIAQEALSNVLRHANATETAVELHYTSDTLMLTVADNGAGFAVDEAAHQAGHYGLLGMNERAAVIDGQLAIVSRPGQGTRVTLCVPLTSGMR